MRIVVNHLTRMSFGYICVAGLDPVTRQHVRLEAYQRLSSRLLRDHGGPIDLGGLLDLGSATPIGRPPEVEDYRVEPRRIRRDRAVTPAEFWDLLAAVAKPALPAIFGAGLTHAGSACTVAVGQGEVSLGCLRLTGQPRLYLRPRAGRPAQVRLRFVDGDWDVDASVTDIRLYTDEHDDWQPNQARISDLTDRLAVSSEVMVSVGLSRPFSADPAVPDVHWLQVNNIHVAEAPLWPRLAT